MVEYDNYDNIVVVSTGERIDLVKPSLTRVRTRYNSSDVLATNLGAETKLGRELADQFVRKPAYPQDETKTPVFPEFERRTG